MRGGGREWKTEVTGYGASDPMKLTSRFLVKVNQKVNINFMKTANPIVVSKTGRGHAGFTSVARGSC